MHDFFDYVLLAIVIAIVIPFLLALYTSVIAAAWYQAREKFVQKLQSILRREQ